MRHEEHEPLGREAAGERRKVAREALGAVVPQQRGRRRGARRSPQEAGELQRAVAERDQFGGLRGRGGGRGREQRDCGEQPEAAAGRRRAHPFWISSTL